MAQARDSDAVDGEVARLRREVERAEYRAEEVTAYYRGQLDSVRRKAEDEAVRVQATEAGRRRRAEEQVGYLKGELKTARADAEHAQRRYQELLQHLEQAEQDGAEHARAEVDRQHDAARAAWKTAEEEVARLDEELAGLQRQLAGEREQRHQLERAYEREVERHQLADSDRVQLIQRLKRALKLSEQRRRALEEQARKLDLEASRRVAAGGGGDTPPPARPFAGAELSSIEVDPAAGWGNLQLGESSELAEEFRLMGADESLTRRPSPPCGAGSDDGSSATPEAAEPVSDQEAETLMMQVDVDRKVARREAAAVQHRRRATDRAPELTPPVQESMPPAARRPWLVAAVCALVLLGLVALGLALA